MGQFRSNTLIAFITAKLIPKQEKILGSWHRSLISQYPRECGGHESKLLPSYSTKQHEFVKEITFLGVLLLM